MNGNHLNKHQSGESDKPSVSPWISDQTKSPEFPTHSSEEIDEILSGKSQDTLNQSDVQWLEAQNRGDDLMDAIKSRPEIFDSSIKQEQIYARLLLDITKRIL